MKGEEYIGEDMGEIKLKGEECIICMGEIGTEDKITLQCKQLLQHTEKFGHHSYHKSCLAKCVANGRVCCPLDNIQLRCCEIDEMFGSIQRCFDNSLSCEVRPDSECLCQCELYPRRLIIHSKINNFATIYDCDPDVVTSTHFDMSFILQETILKNDAQLLCILLEFGVIDVFTPLVYGNSLLHHAVASGYEAIADVLCEYSIEDGETFDVFKPDEQDRSIVDLVNDPMTSEEMKSIINDYMADAVLKTTVSSEEIHVNHGENRSVYHHDAH